MHTLIQTYLDSLFPYLEAANKIVEHIIMGHSQTDYFNQSSGLSKKFILQNKSKYEQELETCCLPAYISFLGHFLSLIFKQRYSLEKFLTETGFKYVNELSLSSIQLPLTLGESKSLYYSANLTSAKVLTSLKNESLNSWKFENEKFGTTIGTELLPILFNLKNFKTIDSINHQELSVIAIESNKIESINQSSSLFQMICCLMQVRLLVEGNKLQILHEEKFDFIQEDALDFVNIAYLIKYAQSMFHSLGQLMISSLKLAERTKFFNMEKSKKAIDSLKQRYQMWKWQCEAKPSYELLYSMGIFSPIISLPYKGIDGLKSSVYNPDVFNLRDLQTLNWEQMESLQASWNEWNSRVLCDAEVRELLGRRLVHLLLWLLSAKSEDGKVTELKKDGVLLDQDVSFAVQKSKKFFC